MSLEQKREYIRRWVFEKGYDQKDFIAFFKAHTKTNTTLTQLSGGSLKKLVQMYLRQKKRAVLEKKPSISNKQALSLKDSTGSKTSNNSQKNKIKDEDLKYFAKKECFVHGKTELSTFNNLLVAVDIPEIFNLEGLAEVKAVYSVRTRPLGWVVKRSYSDFEWLHHCLEKRFSAHYVMRFDYV